VRFLFVILFLAIRSCSHPEKIPTKPVSTESYTDSQSSLDTMVITYNVKLVPMFIKDHVKSIVYSDTLHNYGGISVDGIKKLNKSVTILIYSLYSGTNLSTFIASFKNGKWFQDQQIADESDADYSNARLESTDFETYDTINFIVTHTTETVKDTSLFDKQYWMKDGRSFDEEETVEDSRSTYYRVLESGNIVIVKK
jgi:hypothetical protein